MKAYICIGTIFFCLKGNNLQNEFVTPFATGRFRLFPLFSVFTVHNLCVAQISISSANHF